MVASYERILVISLIIGVLCAIVLVFALFNFSKNKRLILATIIVPSLLWSILLFKKENILKEAKLYLGEHNLVDYNMQSGCILQIKEDFTFSINIKDKTLKQGSWDIHSGKGKTLLLDGKLFGLNEYKIKQ